MPLGADEARLLRLLKRRYEGSFFGLPGLQVENMWVLYEGSTWRFKGLIIGVYLKVWDVGLRVLDEGSMRSA